MKKLVLTCLVVLMCVVGLLAGGCGDKGPKFAGKWVTFPTDGTPAKILTIAKNGNDYLVDTELYGYMGEKTIRRIDGTTQEYKFQKKGLTTKVSAQATGNDLLVKSGKGYTLTYVQKDNTLINGNVVYKSYASDAEVEKAVLGYKDKQKQLLEDMAKGKDKKDVFKRYYRASFLN